MNIRLPLFAATAVLITALTACTSVPDAPGHAAPASDPGHGAIAGAEEVPEPPLALLSVDTQGQAAMLDLLTDETTSIDGVAATPSALASDGRYVFLTTSTGLEIIDSGRWSWDHGDHFHYYRAKPALLGTVPGDGPATVTSGALSTAGSTGVFFAGSREAVLLDNHALSNGELVEWFRIETPPGTGLVAPIGDGALVAHGDKLTFHDVRGHATSTSTECVSTAGAITTRVGIVIGCADGAVLATWTGNELVLERIPYPEGLTERALSFDGRKGRPSVAGVAGASGFWLLDTRERAWSLVPTDRPLSRVVAVDDAEGHVVAIDIDGRVVVHRAGVGVRVGATEPLASDLDAMSLVVDEQRAYVGDAVAGVVYEIDFADGARIARTLSTPTAPVFMTEVGR